ncbi:hypothetical protein GGR22_001211 [Flavobacterium gossypii]|uniref:Carboxypeptidase regulatory-like domain-containing protein n=1 Tax=Flavobacterium gossypii TaxID=1646119 RepID=A0ABR6DQE0_9FLAO|nr:MULTISPECIES: hypothetical protein [Flavobacterium]MBA9073085.1 hypothetical protein [Flavobacterium gossypii]WDO13544.1 hypothetical protein MH928_02310 [Flavobacterium sp. WW92]
MNLKFLYFVIFMLCLGQNLRAQYVEKEEEEKITTLYPEAVFDSIQAKKALALGKGKITGVAFTKTAPLAPRIYADNMKIMLFPVTPYFEAWYKLRNSKENLRKRRYVYMSDAAFRYRLEAISNSVGKFTFPDMKPGKYFLTGNMSWSSTGSYNEHTGTSYGSYGTQADHYEKRYYTQNHEERLEKFVEVKTDGEIVEVKLK